MLINWIAYPSLGTTFGNGRWMVTVHNPKAVPADRLKVIFAYLQDGVWIYRGRRLELPVVGIAQVPEPYTPRV